MKYLLSLLLAFTALNLRAADADAIPPEPAPPAGWTTDFPAALKQAKAENKKVLLDFTGSDWCPNCQELHTNVFTKPEFIAYAKTNFVLVQVDFPYFHKVPDDLAAANTKLQKEFAIEGFPTLILLDTEGKELRRLLGVEKPTVKKFIAEISSPAPAPKKSSVFSVLAVAIILFFAFTGWLVNRFRNPEGVKP